MRFPDFLNEKDTIGFVAPSFGCATEPYISLFNNALKKFKRMGYKAELGPNCYESSGTGISNTPLLCAQELMDMYCSSSNKVLISCGGGELMCEDLDYIDFERISNAAAKWFMGYSDNTNFTFLLTTLCDTASIYGPCAGTFGMRRWHRSLTDAFDILCGKKDTVSSYGYWEKESLKSAENPFAPYNLKQKTNIRYFGTDRESCHFTGRLIGGCMDCLVNITGTRFDKVKEFSSRYAKDGIIWYLEACDLNVMSMRRAVWHMKNAGWFDNVKGFLIGRPLHFDEELMGLDHYHAFTDALKEFNVPIIMDMDIGHLPPMMPLINGSLAEFDGNEIKMKLI